MAKRTVKAGQRFVHYVTQNIYEVCLVATHVDTREEFVAYKAVDIASSHVWLRSLKEFTARLEVKSTGRKPKVVSRFTPIK